VTRDPAVGAAVDLGSNSVHLLVAEIAGHELRPLVDESAFLGLGGLVDQGSQLGAAGRAALIDTLAGYIATARQLGARHITLVGTEPIRRAADAARLVHEVEVATGVPVHVVTHEEEGLLMLVGVTGGAPVRAATLAFDIGGGSSEFAWVEPHTSPQAAGLRIGSERLARRAGTQDPPTPDDIERMRELARAAMAAAPDVVPAQVVAVGGTATNLLKVTAAGRGDLKVDQARIDEALMVLGSAPAETIAERFVLKLTRARLLAAGSVLLEAVLTRYGVGHLMVSDASLREGAILVADHVGRAWRDRLPELAHGWRR
jgi:exopolyphosphatase/pppGpp-phosphohydrolase